VVESAQHETNQNKRYYLSLTFFLFSLLPL
jgi:hypothetical protein